MPTVHVDRINALSIVERLGVIRTLVRPARVVFSAAERAFILADSRFSLQQLALDELPQPFSTLTEEKYEALVLVERSASMGEDDSCVVDVQLKYEHLLDGPNQQLIGTGGIIYGKGRSSIAEKNTNFYRPYGDTSLDRVPIAVAHTFGHWETGIVGAIPPDYPMTVFQTGEINVPFPQSNFSLSGVTNTISPQELADSFIARINSVPWLGKPEFTWLCSDVQWEILTNYPVIVGPVTPLYKFTFEFQFNFDTWNPTVVFNDQRTGRPPADVKKADVSSPIGIYEVLDSNFNPLNGNQQPAGFWTVPFLEPIDFAAQFGSLFEN